MVAQTRINAFFVAIMKLKKQYVPLQHKCRQIANPQTGIVFYTERVATCSYNSSVTLKIYDALQDIVHGVLRACPHACSENRRSR
jgi:hypothetical protein